MPKPAFANNYTSLQLALIDRLAEIEQADADAFGRLFSSLFPASVDKE